MTLKVCSIGVCGVIFIQVYLAEVCQALEGTAFVLGFLENHVTDTYPIARVYISTANPGETEVTISVPRMRRSNAWWIKHNYDDLKVNVTAEQGYIHQFPYDIHMLGNGIDDKGISITATDDITVHAQSVGPTSSDGYLVLPVSALSNNYITLSHVLEKDKSNKDGGSPSEIGIIAATTLTVVEIELVNEHVHIQYSGYGARKEGKIITLILDKYQMYQLQSSDDLSGTKITSSYPIVVLAGAKWTSSSKEYPGDHFIEMLPPIKDWGTEYFTLPTGSTSSGDLFKVVALSDDTDVEVTTLTNVPWIGNIALNARESHHFVIQTGSHAFVKSTKPIMLAQFAESYPSTRTTNSINKNQMMIIVPSFKQWSDHYNVATFLPYSKNQTYVNYISIIISSTSVSQMQINNTTLFNVDYVTEWTNIPRTSYSCATLKVQSQMFEISNYYGAKFYAVAYGSHSELSYGFPLGLLEATQKYFPPTTTTTTQSTTTTKPLQQTPTQSTFPNKLTSMKTVTNENQNVTYRGKFNITISTQMLPVNSGKTESYTEPFNNMATDTNSNVSYDMFSFSTDNVSATTATMMLNEDMEPIHTKTVNTTTSSNLEKEHGKEAGGTSLEYNLINKQLTTDSFLELKKDGNISSTESPYGNILSTKSLYFHTGTSKTKYETTEKSVFVSEKNDGTTSIQSTYFDLDKTTSDISLSTKTTEMIDVQDITMTEHGAHIFDKTYTRTTYESMHSSVEGHFDKVKLSTEHGLGTPARTETLSEGSGYSEESSSNLFSTISDIDVEAYTSADIESTRQMMTITFTSEPMVSYSNVHGSGESTDIDVSVTTFMSGDEDFIVDDGKTKLSSTIKQSFSPTTTHYSTTDKTSLDTTDKVEESINTINNTKNLATDVLRTVLSNSTELYTSPFVTTSKEEPFTTGRDEYVKSTVQSPDSSTIHISTSINDEIPRIYTSVIPDTSIEAQNILSTSSNLDSTSSYLDYKSQTESSSVTKTVTREIIFEIDRQTSTEVPITFITDPPLLSTLMNAVMSTFDSEKKSITTASSDVLMDTSGYITEVKNSKTTKLSFNFSMPESSNELTTEVALNLSRLDQTGPLMANTESSNNLMKYLSVILLTTVPVGVIILCCMCILCGSCCSVCKQLKRKLCCCTNSGRLISVAPYKSVSDPKEGVPKQLIYIDPMVLKHYYSETYKSCYGTASLNDVTMYSHKLDSESFLSRNDILNAKILNHVQMSNKHCLSDNSQKSYNNDFLSSHSPSNYTSTTKSISKISVHLLRQKQRKRKPISDSVAKTRYFITDETASNSDGFTASYPNSRVSSTKRILTKSSSTVHPIDSSVKIFSSKSSNTVDKLDSYRRRILSKSSSSVHPIDPLNMNHADSVLEYPGDMIDKVLDKRHERKNKEKRNAMNHRHRKRKRKQKLKSSVQLLSQSSSSADISDNYSDNSKKDLLSVSHSSLDHPNRNHKITNKHVSQSFHDKNHSASNDLSSDSNSDIKHNRHFFNHNKCNQSDNRLSSLSNFFHQSSKSKQLNNVHTHYYSQSKEELPDESKQDISSTSYSSSHPRDTDQKNNIHVPNHYHSINQFTDDEIDHRDKVISSASNILQSSSLFQASELTINKNILKNKNKRFEKAKRYFSGI